MFLYFCGALIGMIEGSEVNCTVFEDRNHGFGCEVKDIQFQIEEEDMEFVAIHAKKKDSDMNWLQIKNSTLLDLPKNIFLKFINLQKIMIIDCKGIQTFDKEYFDRKLELILVKNSDIEIVGEKVFTNLISLVTVSLNSNKIKTIHKNVFKDLIALEKVEMVSNAIEVLDEDLFAYNSKLKSVLLYNNHIQSLPGKLFARNMNVENVLLQNNKITKIDIDFGKSLTKISKIDLSNNVCINKLLAFNSYTKWSRYESDLKCCYMNFEIVKDTENQLNKVNETLHDLIEVLAAEKSKTKTDFKILEDKLVQNSSELQNYTSHLLSYWEASKQQMEDGFKKDLKSLTIAVKSDLAVKIEHEIEMKVNATAKINQKIFQNFANADKLKQEEIETNVNDLRASNSNNQKFIYFLLFTLIIFAIASVLIVYKKTHLFSKFDSKYDANVQLL